MSKSKGVILMAFGKREYLFMAAHLAMSIKHFNPSIKIKLVHDWNYKYLNDFWRGFIDEAEEIQEKHLYRGGCIDPGWAKCNIYEYIAFDENIYLDVDGICLKDIEPLFNQDKFYATEVIGRGIKVN